MCLPCLRRPCWKRRKVSAVLWTDPLRRQRISRFASRFHRHYARQFIDMSRLLTTCMSVSTLKIALGLAMFFQRVFFSSSGFRGTGGMFCSVIPVRPGRTMTKHSALVSVDSATRKRRFQGIISCELGGVLQWAPLHSTKGTIYSISWVSTFLAHWKYSHAGGERYPLVMGRSNWILRSYVTFGLSFAGLWTP